MKIDFAARRKRRTALLGNWRVTQGERILEAHGAIVSQACEWMAERLAGDAAWEENPEPVILTRKQVQICAERAASQARISAHGPSALRIEDPAIWEGQMERAREMVRNGELPELAAVQATKARAPSEEMTKRLAELAKAHRGGNT